MNKNPPLSFLQIETAANSGAFGHNSLPIPSQAQTLAGNYKLGKTNIYGLPIAIENPRNSYRTGVDSKTGKRWSNRMAAHYGYIQGTKGADGDAIDCFIGVFPQSEHAYIINQYVNGAFDEHKVMLCVPDEATAKSNYLDSYDKGWNGLHSMVKASITQLKWWLKNGNHAKPLQPSHLPNEGIETMSQQIIWDSASNPTNTTLAKLIYDIRLADKDDLLILDSASMGDILAEADEVMVLDAMVSSFGKLPRKMDMLKTVMESAGSEVKPLNVQISEPFKQNGVMQVAAVFELSDGQTISVFFHNPDVTPGKVTASDEMVSWKWLLNKKDITIVVAPEQGRDLNVRAVASRIIKLAEKNSAAFQRANAKRAENMAAIDAIKTEITDLEKQLTAKQNELEVAKVEAEDKLVADQKSQEAFKQSVLQALIDDFGWENQSTTGGNLFWVTKTIGGGREGGVLNPNGDRRLSAKIQGKELVVIHGDNALVTVPFNTDETAVENAKRLDDAVNAIDPRYVAAVDEPVVNPEAKNKVFLLWSDASEDEDKEFSSLNALQQFMREEYQNDPANLPTNGYDKHKFNVNSSEGVRIDVGAVKGDFNPFTDNLSKYLKDNRYDVELEHDLPSITSENPTTPTATVFGGEQNKLKEPNLGGNAGSGKVEIDRLALVSSSYTDSSGAVYLDKINDYIKEQFGENPKVLIVSKDGDGNITKLSRVTENGAKRAISSAVNSNEVGSVKAVRASSGYEYLKTLGVDVSTEYSVKLPSWINKDGIYMLDKGYAKGVPTGKFYRGVKFTNTTNMVFNFSNGSTAFSIDFDKINNVISSGMLKESDGKEDKTEFAAEYVNSKGVSIIKITKYINGVTGEVTYNYTSDGASGNKETFEDIAKYLLNIKKYSYPSLKLKSGIDFLAGQSQPNTQDTSSTHIDTLQSIIDGQHDSDDLNTLLDTIEQAAAALSDAGLGEQYDEMIGKAAEKWAELDQKANG